MSPVLRPLAERSICDLLPVDGSVVRTGLMAQIERTYAAGLRPTHLDSHEMGGRRRPFELCPRLGPNYNLPAFVSRNWFTQFPYLQRSLTPGRCGDRPYGRFSNRPVGVKHFQAIHRFSVNVAHGLVLLFGISTKAVPSWDPRTRRNNLSGDASSRGLLCKFTINQLPEIAQQVHYASPRTPELLGFSHPKEALSLYSGRRPCSDRGPARIPNY